MRMQFSRPLQTGPMPIAPSAVSISGAAAPAMGETNTSMPATSLGTVDASALFAQLLGVSLASIDEVAQVSASESAPLSTAAQTTSLAAPQTTVVQNGGVAASQAATPASTQPETIATALPGAGKFTPQPSFLIAGTLAKFLEAVPRGPRSGATGLAGPNPPSIKTEETTADSVETLMDSESSPDSANSAATRAQLFPSPSTSHTASVAKTPIPAIAAWPSPTLAASPDSKTIFSSKRNHTTPKLPVSPARQTSSTPSFAPNVLFASPVPSPSSSDATIPSIFAVNVAAVPASPSVGPSAAAISSGGNESATASVQTVLRSDTPSSAGTALSTNLPANSSAETAPLATSTDVVGAAASDADLEAASEPTSADATTLAASSYSSLTDRSLTLQFIAGAEGPSSPAPLKGRPGLAAGSTAPAKATLESQLDTQLGRVPTNSKDDSQPVLRAALSSQPTNSPSLPPHAAQTNTQAVAQAANGAPASPLNLLQSHVATPPESTSAISATAPQAQDPLKVTHFAAVGADAVTAHATVPQQAGPSVTLRIDSVRPSAPTPTTPANADSNGSGSGDSMSANDDTAHEFPPISTNDVSASQSASADAASGTNSFGTQSTAASSISPIDPQTQPNPRIAHADVLASAQPTTFPSSTIDGSEPAQIVPGVASGSRVDANAAEVSSAASHAGTAETPLATVVRADRASEAVDSSPLLRAWNGGDNAQTHLVQSAQVGGNLRESQVNIALQADTLGNVEVHARVTGDVVGASIGVDRHDTHAMISGALPALHEALTERQLRVSEVSVFQNSHQQANGALGDGRTSQQRDLGQQRSAANPWTAEQTESAPEIATLADGSVSSSFFDSNGRLSVRA